ncbi:MAG TPA: phage holin family protein [Gaiellaceae bacterium]|jgi:uncharacterized membrane protein YvlD (DUF360 family)
MSATPAVAAEYGESTAWHPERPRIRPVQLLARWLVTAAALFVAAEIVPGVSVEGFGGAVLVVLLITILNAILAPMLAALRLPYTALVGFLLVLFLDAWLLKVASDITPNAITVDSFGWALLAVLVSSAVDVALLVLFGLNDDDSYTLRVVQRIARRSGEQVHTSAPGLVFLEIDGLAAPVLQRAMRDGSTPEMARWLAEGTHHLIEWEPDFSSQTGASQAGILLGSNGDIPAFRWVEKETGTLMTCSAPPDCAEIERRHATGKGLLVSGGASRGNLLSGEADHQILTVSRMEAEKSSNPGYRAFFANGFNVTRSLVLFFWEVFLEWTANLRSIRRDVRPRGHRGGVYPFLRATMCVVVRDLIVFGVLQDMMKGRPAVYATFSSYDEVAHHSGLERADTLEALRKLDQQFGRIARARRYAPRPYEIVVLSDHGQTQGATFKQRNGYGFDDLVERSLNNGEVTAVEGGDEQHSMVGNAVGEATGTSQKRKMAKNDVGDREVVVLGSGNLGLVYLMEEKRRLTLEEIDERHPRLVPALREHPHVGFVLARSSGHGAVALGPRGIHYLADGRIEGDDPLAGFSPNAAHHLRRTDSFPHVADLMVNSFYDHQLEEGCAFEELISFHGGMGGPQTRPFVLYPKSFAAPEQEIVGAEALHGVLSGWRAQLQGDGAAPAAATG